MSSMPTHQAERVWLAPMSGSTDAAFRRQAVKFGAEAVVSEMVAGDALRHARADVVRRICRHEGRGRWIVQLAARRPEDMQAAAAFLADMGVDQIDINMGCPARQVTGGRSGSALTREPELATEIMKAALSGAAHVPVSVKMRLGWDHADLNAPQLARIAQDLGLVMVTLHGRTRCQFYKGEADWSAIAETAQAIELPVIANGDISSVETARQALSDSSAYGVMLGRGAMGRPWLLGEVSAALAGRSYQAPSRTEQFESLIEQIEDSLSLYGAELGLRIVRKHIAAVIDHLELGIDDSEKRVLRGSLCRLTDVVRLKEDLDYVFFGIGAQLERAA